MGGGSPTFGGGITDIWGGDHRHFKKKIIYNQIDGGAIFRPWGFLNCITKLS